MLPPAMFQFTFFPLSVGLAAQHVEKTYHCLACPLNAQYREIHTASTLSDSRSPPIVNVFSTDVE